MPKSLWLSLLLSSLLGLLPEAARAQPVVNVVTPTANQLVGDSVPVDAQVTSSVALSRVQAALGPASQELTFSGSSWKGTLLLTGVPRGAASLVVTATDTGGGSGKATVPLIADRLPTVTVTEPLAGTVARPGLRVVASCTDDDPGTPCSVTVQARDAQGAVWAEASGGESVDSTLDLAAANGQSLTLVVSASDSQHQLTTVKRLILVDDSAELEEAIAAPGPVLDFDGSRVLFIDASGGLSLREASGTVVSVASPFIDINLFVGSPAPAPAPKLEDKDGTIVASTGWFSACARFVGGSVFYASITKLSSSGGPLTEWTPTGSQARGAATCNLLVAGDYIAYGDKLQRQWTDPVQITGTGIPSDLLPSGYLVLSNSAPKFPDPISAYYQGETRVLLTWGGEEALSDGASLLFRRRSDGPMHEYWYRIILAKPSGETELSNVHYGGAQFPGTVEPRRDYEAENGFVAFTNPGAGGGLRQLFLRDFTGSEHQLSNWEGSSVIDGLAWDGSTMVTVPTQSQRFLCAVGAQPLPVGTALGTSRILDQWYVLMGRHVFRLKSYTPTAAQTPDAGTLWWPPADAGQPGADADQPGADADQPGADADQPGADAGQPGADAGHPGTDADQPDAGVGGDSPAPKGCGCGGGAPTAIVSGPLLALGFAVRRRQTASARDWHSAYPCGRRALSPRTHGDSLW